MPEGVGRGKGGGISSGFDGRDDDVCVLCTGVMCDMKKKGRLRMAGNLSHPPVRGGQWGKAPPASLESVGDLRRRAGAV